MTASNLLTTAINHHRAGEFAKAEQLYQKILAEDANQAEVWHLLGILSAQQDKLDIAFEQINKAITLSPDSGSFHNSLGNVLKKQGQTTAAIEQYQIALRLQPNNAAAHSNIGNLYLQNDDLDTAISHYQNALKLKADYADAHYNLGLAFSKKKQFTTALTHFETALQLEKNYPYAHGQIAQILRQQDKLDEAIQHYRLELEQYPHQADIQNDLATVLLNQGNYQEAITYFNTALALDPKHKEALYNLGSIYLLQHKPDQALHCYLQLLPLNPEADVYYNIGVIYMYRDRYQDAIAYLEQALKHDSNYLNAYINLGAIYLRQGNHPKAIEYYQAALKLQPNNTDINYLMNALTGKQTAAAPEEYVQHLFDQYAPYFDTHLLDYLHYQVPELLYRAVTLVLQLSEKIAPAQLKTLDLGCGTGLCGARFRDIAKPLIGIDLSSKMIEIAALKNIYDELKVMSIQQALTEYTNLELIIAGDVLTYCGDLNEIFAQCYQALTIDGLFAFTTEKSFQENFELQKSARFGHNKNYILELAQKYHFTIEHEENVVLRQQQGKAVEGYLFVLKNNNSSTLTRT